MGGTDWWGGLGSADARNERRGLDVGEGRGATGASVRSEVGGDREGAGYSLHKGQCLPPAAAAAAPGAQQASNRAATAPWAPLRPAGPAPKPTALAAAESAAEAGARAEAAVRADAQAVWARAGEQVGGEVQRLMAPLTRLLLALQGTGRTAGVGGGGTAGVGGGGTAGVGGGGTAGVGGGGTAGVGGGDEEERWEGGGAREAGSDGGWGSAAEGCGGEDAGKGGETSGSERGGGWVERVEALRVVRARGRAVRKKRWRATRRAQQTVAWQQVSSSSGPVHGWEAGRGLPRLSSASLPSPTSSSAAIPTYSFPNLHPTPPPPHHSLSPTPLSPSPSSPVV
ncbi:unnamed protein product [Closterium sp. NIES-64]|nr:unnamed protein product [Closterium sp. NIES-64]